MREGSGPDENEDETGERDRMKAWLKDGTRIRWGREGQVYGGGKEN